METVLRRCSGVVPQSVRVCEDVLVPQFLLHTYIRFRLRTETGPNWADANRERDRGERHLLLQ